MHRVTLSFCMSLVTVILLLQVKQLKSAEYKNIACVENIFVHISMKSASKKQGGL